MEEEAKKLENLAAKFEACVRPRLLAVLFARVIRAKKNKERVPREGCSPGYCPKKVEASTHVRVQLEQINTARVRFNSHATKAIKAHEKRKKSFTKGFTKGDGRTEFFRVLMDLKYQDEWEIWLKNFLAAGLGVCHDPQNDKTKVKTKGLKVVKTKVVKTKVAKPLLFIVPFFYNATMGDQKPLVILAVLAAQWSSTPVRLVMKQGSTFSFLARQ